MSDPVNPSHYKDHKVTPMDLILAYDLSFPAGNVIKYVARAKEKNGREDLCKALWCLLIEIGIEKPEVERITDMIKNKKIDQCRCCN